MSKVTHLSKPTGVRPGMSGLSSCLSWTRWCWHAKSLYMREIEECSSSKTAVEWAGQFQSAGLVMVTLTGPRIEFIGQRDIFIIFDHLVGRDDNAVLWLIILNLWIDVSISSSQDSICPQAFDILCALPTPAGIGPILSWGDSLRRRVGPRSSRV